MKKILLVGNGFTSELIKEYKNNNMLDIFAQENKNILQKANQLFEPLRHKVDNVHYVSVGLGICGASDAICGGNPMIKPVTGIVYNPNLIDHIKATLQNIGFLN